MMKIDFQHAIFLLLLDGKLYNAPIGEAEHVLDIATGTGIWAIQFGELQDIDNNASK